MKTNWERYYREQMKDKKLQALVEEELANLKIGLQIAALREEEKLTQTKLAARAGMPSSKISALESSARNLTLETLIKIAHAANRRLEVRFSARRKYARAS